MKHPLAVLPHHEQKHERSCAAWGLELVLKMHGKIQLDEYPLQTGQNPCDWGFGERERQMLRGYEVESREARYDLAEFERYAQEEALKGLFPIFSIPDHVVVDYGEKTASVMFHTYVTVQNGGGTQYLSRSYGSPDILPPLPLTGVFHAVREQLMPDYRIHCLFHRPI